MKHRKIITVTKDDFDPEEKEELKLFVGKYTLKCWNYKTKNSVTKKAMKYNKETKDSDIDSEILQVETIAACLVEAPFEHTKNKPNYEIIGQLPAWLGDELFTSALEINETLTKKRKKS